MTKKKLGPTPELGLPSSKRAVFTYSENKLLDQITVEITEAWAKDLQVIKKSFNKSEQLLTSIKEMEQYLLKLGKFITKNDFISDYKKTKESIDEINSFQGDILKRLWQIDEKINFNYVNSLMKSIQDLEILAKTIDLELKGLKNKKGFWKRLSDRFWRIF